MSERSYSSSPPRSYGSRGDSPIILLVRNLRLDYTRGRSRSRYSSQSPPRNSQSPPPTRRYSSRGLSRSHYSSQSPPYDSLSPPPTRRYSSRGLSRSHYSSQSPPYDSLSPPPTRRYSSQHRDYNVSPPRSRGGSRSRHHPAEYPRAPPRSPSHYCSSFAGTMCRCNRDVAIGTTWTAKNPARKFACCTNLDKPNGCNFLQWAEPEICEKGLEIGRGFIGFLEQKNYKIQTLEAYNESLKSNIVTRNQVALKATRENEDMKMKLQETEEKLKKLESEISSHCVIC
ncbi:PREDICTED: uncharacterized protein LOC105964265 isoform X2 [Erythranthe guttata]|uniref:uncharacterized protein LOC105964265 isoform X2 n=1 Tax=Erythranthe guttata TaxID=4155 RepID=UPI00064D7F2C|nr:PREDICTED: uncharacterized protein LOC105964265 isoform X2 [Erythranthe guttata]|eukprot:XP_012844245.1 PREDICTED: uncharacterized protein LOC105964265 isoform X2 [Erythranthe guttata]